MSVLFQLDFAALLQQEEDNYPGFEYDAEAIIDSVEHSNYQENDKSDSDWEETVEVEGVSSMTQIGPSKRQKISIEMSNMAHYESSSSFMNSPAMNFTTDNGLMEPSPDIILPHAPDPMAETIKLFYMQHKDSFSKCSKGDCIIKFPEYQFIAVAKKVMDLPWEFKDFFVQTLLNAMTPFPSQDEPQK